jgi:AcrR family transcriptional regulator
MATQSERRSATSAAILKAARQQFGKHGFHGTTIDDIADAAGIKKGGFYHHFATKEAVFEAVFEQTTKQLAAEANEVAQAERDVLAAIVAGTRAYFAICAKGPVGNIILRDGPAVLGWERWRQIDMHYFGGTIPKAIAAAMDAGVIARQPVEPLARVLLGAITEAAIACSGQSDIAKAGREYSAAIESMLEALRVRR